MQTAARYHVVDDVEGPDPIVFSRLAWEYVTARSRPGDRVVMMLLNHDRIALGYGAEG